MGISRLWTQVHANYGSSSLTDFEEVVKRCSMLLVDGNGFLFHLMNDQFNSTLGQTNTGYERLHGGNYREISKIIDQELDRLTSVLGFECIFYFDGKSNPFKAETAAQRRRSREKEWTNWRESLRSDTRRAKDNELPLPPLMKEELIFILKRRGIETVFCEYEADDVMAKDCARRNSEGSRRQTYVYSADSDFLVMRDCALISFSSLDGFTLQALRKSSPNAVTYNNVRVPVWRRSKVASILFDKSEDEFVHWCCTELGNDFTKHLISDGNDTITIDDLHLQFSKAFYNLDDLTEFYFLLEEESIDYKKGDNATKAAVESVEAVHDIQDEPKLSGDEVVAIKSWVLNNSNTLIHESSFNSSIVHAFLKDWKPSNLNGRGLELLVQPLFLNSMVEMHRSIAETTNFVLPSAVEFNWEAVCASHIYQLLCKRLYSSFSKIQANCTQLQPSTLFHATLFYHCLNRQTRAVTNIPRVRKLTAPTKADNESSLLPVDAHRETIIQTINTSKVTIIHGETGCGKSSKIPLFLLENAATENKKCKILVAQPRRIAVVNLRNRLKQFVGDKVGMRMGHGIREESKDTQIYFVTTGYLVQLMAHSPQALKLFTHLIVDEVHERSLDGDLLCLLTREYMQRDDRLRVVLMSATLHTELYQTYFTDVGPRSTANEVPPCLSVGARRFPVDVHFIDDLVNDETLAVKVRKSIHNLTTQCNNNTSHMHSVPAEVAKLQYLIAVELIRTKAEMGTSVLVFVSGIADIVEIQERFKDMDVYNVVAIHSDIPFEEQELAMQPATSNEIKVIVATNAAESSITLPSVDTVICLGTHKAVHYQPGDLLRSMLSNQWVSKSSATQRVGRTGRVRPGVAYRLYTRELFEQFKEHQEPEIHSQPLHETVLSLKSIYNGSEKPVDVAHVLQQLLEPPDMSRLEGCLELLHELNMISHPTGDSRLTSHGLLAGRLPVDITLTKLIIYGISLGVGAEATVVAAALMLPKPVFRAASPLIHSDPTEYNEIVRTSFKGMIYFDKQQYSDALMMLNVFCEWRSLNSSGQDAKMAFLRKHGIVAARIRQFVSSAQHLISVVNSTKGAGCDAFTLDVRSTDKLSPLQLNRLRLAVCWALEFNLIGSPSIVATPTRDENRIELKKCRISTEVWNEAFPGPDFASVMKVNGNHVYSLPEIRPSLQEIPQLLTKLFKMVQIVEPSICSAAFICKYEISPARSSLKLKTTKAKRWITKLYVASSGTDSQNYSAVNDFVLCIQHLHNARLCNEIEVTGCDNSQVFSCLLDDNDQCRQIINRYQNMTERFFIITTNPGKETKFVACGFRPSLSILQGLYYEYELNFDYERAAAVVNAERRPEIIKSSGVVVDFSDNATSSTKEDKSLVHELFSDLSMGMRLFNAYSAGYKRRKMLLREMNCGTANVPGQSIQNNATDDNVIVEVPAASRPARWSLHCGFASKESDQDEDNIDNIDKKEMHNKSDVESSSLSYATRWSTAVLSHRSHVSTSCLIAGKQEGINEMPSKLFGVAYKTLIVVTPNSQFSACEGVTLFSPCNAWIHRALLCMGRCLEAHVEQLIDSHFRIPRSHICRDIRQLLSKLTQQPFAPNSTLIDWVDELFEDVNR